MTVSTRTGSRSLPGSRRGVTGREANPTAAAQTHVVVLSYSRFGVIELLAEQVAEGARLVPGVVATQLRLDDAGGVEMTGAAGATGGRTRRSVNLNALVKSDALIVGAPAYFGAMASAVRRFFEETLSVAPAPEQDRARPWRLSSLRDKVGAAFTASATPHGGSEIALQSMLTFFMHVGMLVVTPGMHEPILENVTAPYGATAVAGPNGDRVPTHEELVAARELGRRVAEITRWVKLGRMTTHQHREIAPRPLGDEHDDSEKGD